MVAASRAVPSYQSTLFRGRYYDEPLCLSVLTTFDVAQILSVFSTCRKLHSRELWLGLAKDESSVYEPFVAAM